MPKISYWQNDSFLNCELSQFFLFAFKLGFCLCLYSAYTGKSTVPELILKLSDTLQKISWQKKNHFDKSDCWLNLAIFYHFCVLNSSFLYWPLLWGWVGLISIAYCPFFFIYFSGVAVENISSFVTKWKINVKSKGWREPVNNNTGYTWFPASWKYFIIHGNGFSYPWKRFSLSMENVEKKVFSGVGREKIIRTWKIKRNTGDSLYLKVQGIRQNTYLEISVVWDIKSVMPFTFFRHVELQLARKQSRIVELRNVTDSTQLIHSKNVCDQCLFCTPFPQVYFWYALINFTQFSSTSVTFVVYMKESR